MCRAVHGCRGPVGLLLCTQDIENCGVEVPDQRLRLSADRYLVLSTSTGLG